MSLTSSQKSNGWLVILDLNGTLIETSYRKYPRQYYQFRARYKYVYHRPYLQHFLQTLYHHPNIQAVAVWTSCIRENAQVIVQHLFGSTFPLLFVWNREECEHVADEEDAYKTVKNLNRVWKEYPLFSKENTILLDDSPEKAKYQPECHIKISEYHTTEKSKDSGLLDALNEILYRVSS